MNVRPQPPIHTNERGIALMVVLLVVVAVGAITASAAMLDLNAGLIVRYNNRLDLLESVADAGLEEVRSMINGGAVEYPDTGYVAVELAATVTDANGASIPNVRRSTYVGPTGVTSGQYGVFGSVISVAEDDFGNRVVRRAEVVQESFAKYAYFTNVEGNIWFGGGDQIWGPVHSNDQIKIHYTGAEFHGPVVTASSVYQAGYGTFNQGYTQFGPNIPMPETADLIRLQAQAAAGGMSITGNSFGGDGQATTRIEFVPVDLNGDGLFNGANEGFVRVYQSSDYRWVSGDVPSDYTTNGLENSRNCGHYHGTTFVDAASHPANGNDNWIASVTNNTRRCYPGGSDSLFGTFRNNDGTGGWLPWSGAVSPLVAGRPDAQYLWPISRALNPSFKGVIFVSGKVAISGVVRGKLTLAATDDIIIIDDVTYATDPGAGTCADMLGLFAGDDIVVADNPINAPHKRQRPTQGNGNDYFSYDDTDAEFIHAVLLALDVFTVENYSTGATNKERCGNTQVGRGCLYVTGGIIQRQRGAVGTTAGTGYIKRYSYNQCVLQEPPPYFPTTGHFDRGRFFEVDPVGFSIDEYFRLLSAP